MESNFFEGIKVDIAHFGKQAAVSIFPGYDRYILGVITAERQFFAFEAFNDLNEKVFAAFVEL